MLIASFVAAIIALIVAVTVIILGLKFNSELNSLQESLDRNYKGIQSNNVLLKQVNSKLQKIIMVKMLSHADEDDGR